MEKQKRNNNGFTFIELLAFISVIAIFLLLTVPYQTQIVQKLQEQLFIQQLHQDVLFIQNQSAYSITKPSLRFYDDHYRLLQGLYPMMEKREYPPGWTIISTDRTFQFVETGTLLRPRIITMASPDEWVSFIFPLGKGGFYVEKEKRIHND